MLSLNIIASIYMNDKERAVTAVSISPAPTPTVPLLHSIFSQYRSVVHQELTLNRLSNSKFLPKEGIQLKPVIKSTACDSLALEISLRQYPLLKEIAQSINR